MVRSEPDNGHEVEIRSQSDVILARRAGRTMARDLGFGTADQTRLATAISELARNALTHGGGGSFYVSDSSDDRYIRVLVTIVDHGPGIEDIELALMDGYSTGGSLGAGLPGARRLVQDFKIESGPGGTTVSVMIIRPRR